jgi:hypothetical protein
VSCDFSRAEIELTTLKANTDGYISYRSCKDGLKCGGGGVFISPDYVGNSRTVSISGKRAYIYLEGDIAIYAEMFIENKNCGNYTLEYKKGTIVDYTKSRLFIIECKPK